MTVSPGDPSLAQWHFHTAATGQQGPVGFAQLQAMALAGSLVPTDLVWTDGMAEWTPAAQIEGLRQSTTPPSAVTPPPTATSSAAPAEPLAPPDAFDYSPFARQPSSGNAPINRPSGNYIVDHWRGQLPLGISVWINGFLLSFGWRLLTAALLSGLQYSPAAFIVVAGLVLLAIPLSVWILVGIWRSADRHESRGGKAGWAIAAKFLAGLGWLLLVVNVVGWLALFTNPR